jgi:ferric-dicitrate binding protein FerR (iron transport regulator)
MTKELLIKFLNNRCTSEELGEVIEWVNSKALREKEMNFSFDDWNSYAEESKFEHSEKFDALLDKIHHKINIENSQNKSVAGKKATMSLFAFWLTRAAAILLLPVLAFLTYTLYTNNIEHEKLMALGEDTIEIVAPIGSRTLVHLSDGSEVHLNYGSKICYPQKFIGDTREVVLVGEGYFKVAHNPEKPFIVKTGKLNIKALGTSFNVNAYPETNEIATTLVNGKVVLEKTTLTGEAIFVGVMKPGQHVSYNTCSEKAVLCKGNIEKYIAWKDGKLMFDNESIALVVDKLSRMFNVDIEVADEVKDYTYTVTFVDEPLFQILDLMTVATRVTYEILPRNKQPDGTFSKQKIIIKERK